MFHSYEEVLQYLYANLPMFQRVGASAFKKDLTNTLLLCEELGNPHQKFKSIHVAGTNGKGSTSHMLASILQSSGYKAGLYTSPHLKNFTERIRVNGEEVARDFIVDFVNRIRPAIERLSPSFFEITVAMAFDYFARQQVDVAVIEVGLGGRLDSTNVITPELSVITNIGWDHKDLLGDTLEKIAAEKAGVIKPRVPVVISERQSGLDALFLEKAKTVDSKIYFASDAYQVLAKQSGDGIVFDVFKGETVRFSSLALPLQGLYQHKNLTGVLKAIEVLNDDGWQVSDANLLHGLMYVTHQTNLKGRWQKLSERPLVICDTGHNVDGVREVVRQIKTQSFEKLHMVWGAVRDKDIGEILQLLPTDAKYYFCQADIPRAMEANALAQHALEKGLKGEVVPQVREAVKRAKAAAKPEDMIFIGGSTFVVAEVDDL